MKIDSNTTRLLADIAANAKAGGTVAPAATLPPSTSSAGTAVSRTGSSGASGPGAFDAAKVERIRTAIEAGTYQIDPEAIADGMIADARSFTSAGVF